MSGFSLSDDELRGLTEGAGDPAPRAPIFSPRDFADASRAAHRLFGKGIAGLGRALGSKTEPLPPEIRVTIAEAVRAAAERNPDVAFVLEFTGQFRATAALILSGDPIEMPQASPERWTVLAEALAREAEVAFRAGFRRNVAIELAAVSSLEEEPLLLSRLPGGIVALEFDLEAGRHEPIALSLVVDSSFVRELAELVRPAKPVAPAAIRGELEELEEDAGEPIETGERLTPEAIRPEARELEVAPETPHGPLSLAAEIGRCSLDAAELSALTVGQVVRLDAVAGDTAALTVRGEIVAIGEVIVTGGHLGLRLSEVRGVASLGRGMVRA